ncbi:MAG TPA: CvpA family protein, partial [Lapidilactobacillus dextrinicus]|nr:CvpA family protein [Lapidilactobacillus dextrinicus]
MTIFSWIIIILIILAMIHGYRLGLVRSLTMLVGRLIVYTFAILLAHKFGSWLYDMFVNGIVANWTATNVPATAMSQP